MTFFVIYLFISGIGFPVCLGLLLSHKKKHDRKEETKCKLQ